MFIIDVMAEDILDDKDEEFLDSLEKGIPGFPVVGESLEQEA